MLWPKHLLHCAEKINAPAKSPAHQQKHPMQIPRVTSKNQGQFESLWDDHKRTSLRVSGIHALMRLDPKRLDQQVRHARDSGTISFLPALLKGSLERALTDCRWKKCSQHNSKLQIPNFKGKIFHPPSLDLRNFFSTSALLSARSNSSQSTLQENFESTSILALAMALKLWTKM